MIKINKLFLNSCKFFTSAVKSRGFSVDTSKFQTVVTKINDLKKQKIKSENDVERCKLASVYRLIDLRGWSWNIYNHITLRCKDNSDHFLINPFGLFYSEITAGNLLKIDSNCKIIERGSTTYGLNKAGFTLHSTIHDARKDINAVIHIHTGAAAGLSALKHGFLPISQEALICGKISYHDYAGILIDDAMKEKISKDLGPENKILILRNHGVAICGRTIEEAWFYLITFMTAVDIQSHALSSANGLENLIIPPDHVLEQVQNVVRIGAGGVNEKPTDDVQWNIGELEFEAEMRKLDLLGYETGYPYKKPPQIEL